MSLEQQITAAVGAHGLWKGRLRAAVDSGKCDIAVNVARDDNQCNFGKWLHGPEIDAAAKQSKGYGTCVELHRRFHYAAAEILSLALEGRKQEAAAALGGEREFSKVSADLTRAMMAWKGH